MWTPRALCRLDAENLLEFGPAQQGAKDRAAWLEEPARAQALQPDCDVAKALDDILHDLRRARVVAGDADRAAFGRARRPPSLLEVLVADVVQALDHRRPRKPALNHFAAGVPAALEKLKDRIRYRPRSHPLDDKLFHHHG